MDDSPTLVASLLRKLRRDRGKPARVLLDKGLRYAVDLATAPVFLRGATSVGRRPRTRGWPCIENRGRLDIGDDFQLVSRWVPSHLVVGPGGALRIGDQVNVNFGAAISAHASITIGSRVRLGPYAIVMDSDFHSAHDRGASASAPIVIEDDAWLAARVTVLKGARIGRGAVIGANAVVSGDIPPGVVAVGVPARPVRRAGPDDVPGLAATPAGAQGDALAARVEAVVRDVFGWAGALERRSGPESVTGWDSLGHVRLVRALEDAFGRPFAASEVVALTSVGAIADVLSRPSP